MRQSARGGTKAKIRQDFSAPTYLRQSWLQPCNRALDSSCRSAPALAHFGKLPLQLLPQLRPAPIGCLFVALFRPSGHEAKEDSSKDALLTRLCSRRTCCLHGATVGTTSFRASAVSRPKKK